jgi:PemK-like, MazF-like toxin of type II toxin-antitoxin system
VAGHRTVPPTITLMGRITDIGSYFEKLTKKGRGGSRLEGAAGAPASPTVRDRLRDVVTRGRETVERARGRNAPPTGGARRTGPLVTVEYSPTMDGDPDPGEVVWVWVPFEEDPTQGKDRPVVVIGRRGEALVGVPLTSKQHDDEVQVNVGTGDWDSKRRTSYARIWRLLDVDPTTMRREGAVLDRVRFDEVIEAVDEYYDIKRVETAGSPRRRRPAENDDF